MKTKRKSKPCPKPQVKCKNVKLLKREQDGNRYKCPVCSEVFFIDSDELELID